MNGIIIIQFAFNYFISSRGFRRARSEAAIRVKGAGSSFQHLLTHSSGIQIINPGRAPLEASESNRIGIPDPEPNPELNPNPILPSCQLLLKSLTSRMKDEFEKRASGIHGLETSGAGLMLLLSVADDGQTRRLMMMQIYLLSAVF